VPVPVRPIARDEVVAADAVHWIEMRADRVPANALTDDTQIVGQQARRALKADAVVRATDMRTPVIVTKGEVITMSYAIPGVQLTDRGRALENGGQDQIIRIVNLTSNRTISAQVAGPGLVRVAGSLGAMR
jgi:flagella basal body P-ring formation protein FlgA